MAKQGYTTAEPNDIRVMKPQRDLSPSTPCSPTTGAMQLGPYTRAMNCQTGEPQRDLSPEEVGARFIASAAEIRQLCHIIETVQSDGPGHEVKVTIVQGGKSANGYSYDQLALQ